MIGYCRSLQQRDTEFVKFVSKFTRHVVADRVLAAFPSAAAVFLTAGQFGCLTHTQNPHLNQTAFRYLHAPPTPLLPSPAAQLNKLESFKTAWVETRFDAAPPEKKSLKS